MNTNNINYKHGLSNTRIYQCWKSMRRRVFGKNAACYKNYGGRNIRISKDWDSFEQFYKDMYPTYRKDLTLDRIDNNKDYSKDNCRWATKTEQSRNRRNTKQYSYKGEDMFLVDISKKYKINYGALKARVGRLGMSIEKAIEMGDTKPKYYCLDKRVSKYVVSVTKTGTPIYGGKFETEKEAQKKVEEILKSIKLL